ncbi:apolipoprotein A-IV-like isoform X2 [Eriocheir sinensis]|uniref:apolipoprotein A-IV-like isoform X2 n=1 Tax=Eriocheir sinensis TaxID=95602 RepID=UPI0021C6A856|nr:apolipoprotein A-IV-like isoform X2 [Eriocheir sinensis]
MSALRLVTLVLVSGATCCLGFQQDLTENPDAPEYLLVAHHFADIIRKDIEDKLAPITSDIEEMKSTMRETCNSARQEMKSSMSETCNTTQQQISTMRETCNTAQQQISTMRETCNTAQQQISTMRETCNTELQQITRKLNEALQKTEALEGKLLQKIEDLKLSSNGLIEGLQNDITTEIEEGSRRLEKRIFTKDEMVEVVRQEAVELKDRCRDDSRLTALQNNVLEMKEVLQEVKGENVEMKSRMEQYFGQNVSEEVRDVKNFVEVMAQEVERLAMSTRNVSSTLEDVSHSVHLLTATPPPPPPQEEEEEEEEEQPTGPVYPCLDSTFPTGADICAIAVKFKKCHLLLPSYHCCHTCTTNGHLPEMGFWRHLNLNREITGTQMIYLFST